MLDIFADISETVHFERTDGESGVITQMHQGTQAYIYRGRDSTELGSVVEVLSEYTVILMEIIPLDIRINDTVVRSDGTKLRLTAPPENNYYTEFTDINHQRLITEQTSV